MSHTEKSYSFLVNKSALESADVSPKVRLQSFSDLTGTTSLIGILQARHVDFALAFIKRAQSFTVRSYHGPNGLIIPGCTLDDGTLKLTDAQTSTNCRPADIQYVKIACDVVFTDLTPNNTQTLSFYLLCSSRNGIENCHELYCRHLIGYKGLPIHDWRNENQMFGQGETSWR
jgi:hypothetical protein